MSENELNELSFEDALQKLEILVRELESGRIKLDDAVSAYEKAVALKKLCEEKGKMDVFHMYDTIEKLSPKAFAEVKGVERVMCANVDLYSGLIYRMLNIPQEMFTPIFAIARTAGWCAHRIEEIVSKGKIIRPAYKTVFKKGKQYIDIESR